MKKLLLSCLLLGSMVSVSGQINLGVGSTTVGDTNTGFAPISTYYGYSYVQQIITKQELNTNAAGNITGVKFYLDSGASLTNSNSWKIYLGHTTKAQFDSKTDWITLPGLTEVYTGGVTNNNGVVEITFTTPFAYNNTDNLVVAAVENSSSYDSNNYEEAFYVYNTGNQRYLGYRNDYTAADPSNTSAISVASTYLLNGRSAMTLLGLAPSAIPTCPSVTYPANNATNIPLSPTVTWNSVSGATSYKVSLGTTSGGTDILNQVSSTTASYALSTALQPNTVYYLKVTALGTGGESVNCSVSSFTTTPPPPANDECANAVTLTVNPDYSCGTTTPGTTLSATPSQVANSPCYGNADDDVWYKFVATNTTHKISLLNVQSVGTTTSSDIYMQLLSGGCGSLISVQCSDPNDMIVDNLTVGSTYLLRVYSYYGAGNNQSFDVCVGTPPPTPANDNCSGAYVASTFPYSYTQNDGAAATNNGGFLTCGNSSQNDGTWFTFTGDGSLVTITATPSSSWDPEIGVFSGTCGNLSCFGSVDSGGSGTAETIDVQTVAGTTYYVNVGHYSGYSDYPEDNFTITMTKTGLGTSETAAKDAIKVYPNPFVDVLNISDIEKVASITINDISGKLIQTVEKPVSELHLGKLTAGLYIVTLNMKDGSKQTIKAIKK